MLKNNNNNTGKLLSLRVEALVRPRGARKTRGVEAPSDVVI
jgi:hypothetical protein